MTKRIIALLLALILTVGLLPTVALAAGEAENNDVVPGKYVNGVWTAGDLTQTLPAGVESINKTATKKSDNTYEVTLKVVLKQTEENSGKAATVLVLDTSGSMAYCAECGAKEECEHNYVKLKFDDTPNSSTNYYYKTTDKNGREEFNRAYYCDGNHKKNKHNAGWFNSNKDRKHTVDKRLPDDNIYVKTTRTSRLDAAKVAAENFLKTYSGLTFKTDGTPADNQNNRNLGRYVSVVSFATGAALKRDWIDVSNANNYQSVLNKIKALTPDGGTNLDAGLTYAEYLLNDKDVNGAVKNVIALTDGEPTFYLSNSYWCNDDDCKSSDTVSIGNTTYYVHGSGRACSSNTKTATENAAASVKKVSNLYTVCFGVANDKMKQWMDPWNSNNVIYWKDLTVGQYLGSLASKEEGKTFAYAASNANELNAAFAAITHTIVSGLDTGTVNDTLPTGITGSTATANGQAITSPMTWKLDDDFDVERTKTEGDKKVTTYTYTKTYYVTIDPEKAATTKINGEKYAPLNGETTLTVEVAGEEKTIPFPIPAGKVTPKEYTVKGIIDNGGKVNNTDSPYTETVESGKTSKAMTFTPAAGYEIKTITEKIGDGQPATITVTDKNSYTYPAKGNVNANITVDVKTAKRSDLKYVVKHVEKGNERNVLETENKTGTLDAVINGEVQKKTFTGFTYAECSPESITISATEDNNVITLYYTRNKHNITYQYEGDTPTGAPDLTMYGEANVPYDAEKERKPAPSLAGWTFEGWTTSDVTVGNDGTFKMPDKNVTFTGSWTEKGRATINYVVVGPEGCGTVTPASETPYVDADAKAVSGSKATATDGYRFVGWYDNEGCTGTALSTDASYTPSKPEAGWADKTYYAKFESLTYTITFETETGGTLTGQTNYTGLAYNADFPAEPGKSANSGYYFDGWYKNGTKVTPLPQKVTENATYTAKWLSYNSIGLDLTGKIQKTLNSDVELSNQRFTINVKQTGAEVASATATATVSATTISDPGYTGSAPFQKDDFKLNFTAPGIYNYSIVEAEDGQLAGMTYDVGFDNGHTMIVNVDENTTTNELYVKSVTIDGKPVYAHGETEATPTWLTITNNYVEPKETFDLNTLISKNFVKDPERDGKDIPTGTYEFKAQIVETDSSWNKIDSGATYEGTATLTAGGTADFAFGNDRYLKLAAGDHYYLVSEISDTVSGTTGTISYDNLTYSLKITVGPNGKVTDVEVKNFAVVSSFAAENAVEFKEEDHITFNNTYFEEKDPNKCTIDFSKFVKKELTATGSKTVDEATFIVDVAGSYDGEAIANALPPTEMQATTDEDVLNTTLTASIKNIVGGNVYEEPFTGSVTVSKPGHYTFTLTERKGTQSGVTYDESTYQVFVNIKRIGDNLVIRDAKTYLNNEPVELIKLENDAPVTAGYIIFKNTIDTGRDDYIPIIIPTIINKDTGMLNKTDHFAYVIGYPDGTVHPNGQITRAEVATIFFRLLRDEVRDGAFTTSNTYSDVAYGKWYNNPISTMSALGIITGYPDGTFKPNKPITRAEFAAIAARFDETQSGKSATFSDVIGHWAAKEIGIAYYNDWIKGYPDGTFKPDQNITRAEAMTLINRVLERKPESPADLLTNMNKWTDNMDTSKWYYLDVQEATNSHGYTRKTFNYELWRQMLPDPDWSRYER